jgi:hypothetical protein
MQIDLGRGLWRVWLFFTLIWVGVCAWTVYDANSQAGKAESLLAYYKDSALAAQKLENGHSGVSPLVSAHLNEQIELNQKIVADQHARGAKFFFWAWFFPLVGLVLARGIPWVVRGFAPRG